MVSLITIVFVCVCIIAKDSILANILGGKVNLEINEFKSVYSCVKFAK